MVRLHFYTHWHQGNCLRTVHTLHLLIVTQSPRLQKGKSDEYGKELVKPNTLVRSSILALILLLAHGKLTLLSPAASALEFIRVTFVDVRR